MAGANILVVEDQRAVAGALRMRLRGLGYEVLGIAKDGSEAIAKAREMRPDLILMDIKLGDGMDGIEAAREIRDQLDIPVVYVSAYADPALLDRARATHPAGFINKPFTTKDLLTAIDLALHRRDDELKAEQLSGGREGRESDPVITADRDGRVTFVNRRAEQIIGCSRDALNGQPLANVLCSLYGIDVAAAKALIDAAFVTGEAQQVVRTAPGDGEQGEPDLLTPLRDARGSNFGLALRLGQNSGEASAATLQRTAQALRFVMDQLPLGIVVLDRDLRVLHANAQARALIENSPALSVNGGRLGARDAYSQQSLQDIVQRASDRGRTQSPEDVTSELYSVEGGDGERRLLLVAMPVPGDAQGAVALLAFGPAASRALSAPVLQQVYGLTRAEITLVQSLAQGLSLEEAAQHIGIAVNTARTHLKHIFVKTGAKRQSELMLDVETGPAALPIKLER